MKEYKLTLAMPDSFEPGECFDCPLAIRDDDAENYCVMHYRYCDCPLREGQSIEEEYTD